MRVLRWTFEVADRVILQIPQQAQLLMVKAVGLSQIEIWALCEEDAPLVDRRLRVAGTGHHIQTVDAAVYVGSTVSHDSPARLVWHVFDLGEWVG